MFSSDVDVVIVKQVGKIDLVMVKLVEINCLATSMCKNIRHLTKVCGENLLLQITLGKPDNPSDSRNNNRLAKGN
jgi:hypothetical protein